MNAAKAEWPLAIKVKLVDKIGTFDMVVTPPSYYSSTKILILEFNNDQQGIDQAAACSASKKTLKWFENGVKVGTWQAAYLPMCPTCPLLGHTKENCPFKNDELFSWTILNDTKGKGKGRT